MGESEPLGGRREDLLDAENKKNCKTSEFVGLKSALYGGEPMGFPGNGKASRNGKDGRWSALLRASLAAFPTGRRLFCGRRGEKGQLMRWFVGMDDTDVVGADRGTGKVARFFGGVLPEGWRCLGAVRQQLLVDPRIPYTSHNSAACLVVEGEGPGGGELLADLGAAHLKRWALPGSDPGLCVAPERHPTLAFLAHFGERTLREVVSQREAQGAAEGLHLSAHGGTGDGIIGAAAAVGLTAAGWRGRCIDWGDLRSLPEEVPAAELERRGIRVVWLERDAFAVPPEAVIQGGGWFRPFLLGGTPVLLVRRDEEGVFRAVPGKDRGHRDDKERMA